MAVHILHQQILMQAPKTVFLRTPSTYSEPQPHSRISLAARARPSSKISASCSSIPLNPSCSPKKSRGVHMAQTLPPSLKLGPTLSNASRPPSNSFKWTSVTPLYHENSGAREVDAASEHDCVPEVGEKSTVRRCGRQDWRGKGIHRGRDGGVEGGSSSE